MTTTTKETTKLRDRRVARGLTLRELAERTGYSKTHLNDVESGRIGPGAGLVRELARILKLKPATVLRYAQEAARDS